MGCSADSLRSQTRCWVKAGPRGGGAAGLGVGLWDDRLTKADVEKGGSFPGEGAARAKTGGGRRLRTGRVESWRTPSRVSQPAPSHTPALPLALKGASKPQIGTAVRGEHTLTWPWFSVTLAATAGAENDAHLGQPSQPRQPASSCACTAVHSHYYHRERSKNCWPAARVPRGKAGVGEEKTGSRSETRPPGHAGPRGLCPSGFHVFTVKMKVMEATWGVIFKRLWHLNLRQ